MPNFSWIPGLPSFGNSVEIWAVDPFPENKKLSEYQFLIEKHPGGGGRLLANRNHTHVEIEPPGLVEDVTQEKQHTEIDGEPIFIKRFRLVDKNEPIDDDFIELPKAVVDTPLPPAELDL